MRRSVISVLLISVILLAGCATGGDEDTQPADPTPTQEEQIEVTPDAQDAPTATFIPAATSAFNDDDDDDDREDPDDLTPQPDPTFRDIQGTIIPLEQVTEQAAARELAPTVDFEEFVAPQAGQVGRVTTVEAPPPDVNDPPLTGFDYIYFERTGGPQDIDQRFELYEDGRVNFLDESIPDQTASQAQLQQIAALIDEVDFYNIQGTFISVSPPSEDEYRYRMAAVSGSTQRAIQAQDGLMPPEIIRLFSAVLSVIEDRDGAFVTPEATQEVSP